MIPRDVIAMRDKAREDETYLTRCINGEKVFYVPADKAYVPGHIYSEAGIDEYKISNCCEWHFDQYFKEED